MYSQTDINDAVAGGALTEEQAASLRGFVARRNGAPTGDEEYVRILLGFNDLFVFTACFFALAGAGWLGTLIPISSRGMGMGPIPIQAPFAALFVAAASWGLAEIFTRKRYSALPGILLTFGFAWGVAFFLLLLLGSAGGMRPDSVSVIASLSFAAGAGAAWLHWKRFRVPIAIALAAGTALLALLSLLATSMRSPEALWVIMLLAGIGCFLWAMWWDGQDPPRLTEKADVAFWLHWLGGALMINGLAQLFGVANRIDSMGGAIVVLILYALLGLLALVVNRKVYLLAGVSPLMLALQNLFGGSSGYDRYAPDERYGAIPYRSPYGDPYGGGYPIRPYRSAAESVEATMLTFLIVGIILVLLAIYWAPVRRKIVGLLPESLRARVPPTGMEAEEQATAFE